jgi:HTH-type transcriptional regulator/antitoxin HigA
MANDPAKAWQPNWLVAPGEILLEALSDRGMTQAELAQRTARPAKTINEIIKGKAAVTAETAIQLERVLGISARFWNGLEAAFREGLARLEAQQELEANVSWLDGFPVVDMVRRKLIERGTSKAETLASLLAYLGLSSPEAFDRHWMSAPASLRSAPAFEAAPKAVAAWLRWGEREASKIEAPPFDADRFRQVLAEIRPLTRRAPFTQIIKRVKEMCRASGVVLVLIPELEGTHLSGAVRWLGSKAIIQLSLRYKTDDQFWFTFFHEAGHLLTGSRRLDRVDSAEPSEAQDDAEERAADQFARDQLLPPQSYLDFVAGLDFSEASIRSFAETEQIAAGIVVGRLQADDKIPPAHSNKLKKAIHFAE